jgi:hypothetical protein
MNRRECVIQGLHHRDTIAVPYHLRFTSVARKKLIDATGIENPETVEEVTKKIMRTMNISGGYIAAPTHDMPGDIPVENMLAMFKAFEGG